jgi:2-haloacid dehalogenase
MAIPMKTYAGFLLDADNTLFDYDAAETEALHETFQAFMPDVPVDRARESYRTINARYWAEFEKGAVALEELKTARFADLLSVLGRSADAREMGYSYLRRLSTKVMLLPHAREVIEELGRRARLCLITNGISLVQRGRLAASGLAPSFTAVLVSEELGCAKPDLRFFAAACRALALPPSDVLCVGDNPVADVAGARAAGIDACWFAPHGRVWTGPGEAPLMVARDLRDIVHLAPRVFP